MCELCCGTYGELLPHNYVLQADAENNFMSGEEVKCLASGYTQYICSNCGDEYYTDLTPADGHDVEIVTMIYPKCNETGEALVICNTCGVSYTMTLPCDTENGHSWVPDNDNWYNQWEDSCNFSIVFNGYCEYCGIFDSYTLPPTLEHDIQELNRREPSCGEDGYIYYNCIRCHECGYYEDIPTTEQHEIVTIVEEPTCGDFGCKYEYCTKCNEIIDYFEDYYSPTEDHVWIDVEAKEPTCSEWGWAEHQECSVCHTTTEYEDYAPSGDCDYQLIVSDEYLYSPATCTRAALYHYVCSKCGVVGYNLNFYAAYGEPVGHVDEDGNMVCDACGGSLCDTCVDDDFNHRCDVCGGSMCEWCMDDDGDYHCDVCGLSLCSHDWYYERYEYCEREGESFYQCCNCGETRDYTVLQPMGHDYHYEYDYEEPATCTEDGMLYEEYYCWECGDNYSIAVEVIPAFGHAYAGLERDPSCSSMGRVEHTCSICGHYEEYDIPMTPHTIENVVIAPSCYADGFTREVCTVCHKILDEYDVVPQYGAHVNENGDYNCDRCNASLCAPHNYQTAYNGTYHYSECIQCGAIDPSTITGHYDDTLDNTCDVCGACTHLFTTYTYDKLNHTVVCDICGFEHVSEHELVEKGTFEATCGMYGGIIHGCTDCDYTYTVKTADATGEHANFTYGYNEDLHWSICGDCGLIVSRAKHGYRIETVVYRSCHYNECDYWYCTDGNCGYGFLYEFDRECMGADNDGICADCEQCIYHSEWNDEDGDGLCDRCGKCIEHTYVLEETFEPTCGEVGKSKYNCSVCGFVLYKDYTRPTEEHNLGEPLTTVAPTCNEKGYTLYECLDCGREIKKQIVPETREHIDVDGNYYCDNEDCNKLLCEDHVDENSDMHCDMCKVSYCTLDDYGHEYDEYSYYHDGGDYHWFICNNCGDKLYEEEHYIWCDDDYVPCGEDTRIYYQCEYCSYSYHIDVPARDHIDNNNDYECDHCGTSYCEINGEDHDNIFVNKGGYHHFECSKCGEYVYWGNHQDDDSDGLCDICDGAMDYVEEECYHEDTCCSYIDDEMHDCYCAICGEFLGNRYHDVDMEGYCYRCGEYIG